MLGTLCSVNQDYRTEVRVYIPLGLDHLLDPRRKAYKDVLIVMKTQLQNLRHFFFFKCPLTNVRMVHILLLLKFEFEE